MASDIREPAGVSHRWQPIAPLGETGYDFQEITSLQRQWLRVKRSVETDTPHAYAEFTARLTRRWAIETGIIEGVYELDKGITETLVENGIAADHIERVSTNKEPMELMAILRDHQNAVATVNSWIEKELPLTKSFIYLLHSQILNNQHTSPAKDQFGNLFNATLVKGKFKNQPNNPKRPDGTIHEYCPPEHVDSEIENLFCLYNKYSADDKYHPLLLAAWLHHRFEQIHPFQDGNGRVGRAILTWHLARNEFFPIVVSRDDKDEYLDALETADDGDLTPLIDLFVRLEKHTILQALYSDDAAPRITPEFQPQSDTIKRFFVGIGDRVERRQSEAEHMRSVNNTALELRRQVQDYLHQKSQEIWEQSGAVGIHIDTRVEEGGPDKNNEHWYRLHTLETAKHSQHRVNLSEHRYFVKLYLNPSISTENTPRLTFVVSLHHTGRRITGIMVATAFAQIEHQDDVGSTLTFSQASSGFDRSNFKNCAADPFTFALDDSVEDISDRFADWTEACFGVALRYWMESF